MRNNWIASGNVYALKEVSQQTAELPVAIYRMAEDPRTMEISLLQTQQCFEFPYKVYGIEEAFINRVIKTYQNTRGNLGILLNGLRGTGKTVTCRMICNALNLPVLIVPESYENIPAFLNVIQQDVIVLFDEYEKIYRDYRDKGVLSVMDGALNSDYRRVFLLTTNRLDINENLLQRPGRIRYIKTYGDLSLQNIIEIVDDMLVHKALRRDAIEFIANLECITVDIVKSVVEEMNIHAEPPSVFGDVFNIKPNGGKFDVYEIQQGAPPKLAYSQVTCRPAHITREHINFDFYIDNKVVGEILSVLAENQFTVMLESKGPDDPRTLKTFKLEQQRALHREFFQYTF